MQGQWADTSDTKGVSYNVPFLSGAVNPKPCVEAAEALERAQIFLLENHGISMATALAADTDALVSRDAVVISPSFRAAVGHEAVIRQDHLHSAKQASRKLSLTGGVSLVLCFRPGQLRDLQCHNPVSVRSQLQRKTLKT